MNLLKDNIQKLFFKFLFPAIGGALVVTLYSFVDTIVIGQGVGPNGTAACAVILPIFCIAEFIGLTCGIGGSVLMSKARGSGHTEKGNAYFTASLIGVLFFTIAAWITLRLFQMPIYRMFGADDALMPYAYEYGNLIALFLPSFVLVASLACFVRNDGAPNLVMRASLIGAAINILGDLLFVFPMNMGMFGAALATVIGSMIQVIVMGGYLFTKQCGLKFIKPYNLMKALRKITIHGFGAGFGHLSIIVVLFIANNQIMKYAGTAALAIYGMISTVSTLFVHIYNGVGQAAQPIASMNYGAGNGKRCQAVYRLGINTSFALGLAFMVICLILPKQITKLFMKTTEEVLLIAPMTVRIYAVSFLPLAINTFLGLYLQSVMQPKPATAIALLRGLIVNSIFLIVFPLIMGEVGIWIAFSAAEAVVAIYALSVTQIQNRNIQTSHDHL